MYVWFPSLKVFTVPFDFDAIGFLITTFSETVFTGTYLIPSTTIGLTDFLVIGT
jgi:hypothetical protein